MLVSLVTRGDLGVLHILHRPAETDGQKIKHSLKHIAIDGLCITLLCINRFWAATNYLIVYKMSENSEKRKHQNSPEPRVTS